MPDANGNPLPTDPGYVPPAGQTNATGLINSTQASGQMNTTAAPAANPTAPAVAPYTPINQPGIPQDKTVSGGVEKIIATNSPLMQQAEARAAQKMNERGLLNSSQAITAGQAAVLDAAVPIASADAQQATSKYTADLASNTQLQAQTVDNAFKMAYQQADAQSKLTLQAAHDAASQTIANTEANYKTLMQTSSSAADVYKSTIAAISQIYADTSIDAAGKARVINNQLGMMTQQLNLIGSVNGVDLSGLTNFGTMSA